MKNLIVAGALLVSNLGFAAESVTNMLGFGLTCEMVKAGERSTEEDYTYSFTFYPASQESGAVEVDLVRDDGWQADDNIYSDAKIGVGQLSLRDEWVGINIQIGGLGTERLDTIFATYENEDTELYLVSSECDVL